MPFQKGQSGNPAGRPKGSKNRGTKELRAALMKAIAGHIDRIPEYLDSLETNKRIDAISRLLPYLLPRLNSTELIEPPRMAEILNMSKEEQQETLLKYREAANVN